MLVAWLAPFAFIYLCLMAVSPTFREVVTLGAFKAAPRPTRREKRAGRGRLRRLLRRRADQPNEHTEWRVLVPLIGVAHWPVDDVRDTLAERGMPSVRVLDVRRGDGNTTAELLVLTTDPMVAVRHANRLAIYAGLIPGATHPVE
jgi:hypothetical protein